jgi:hypothetical protein
MAEYENKSPLVIAHGRAARYTAKFLANCSCNPVTMRHNHKSQYSLHLCEIVLIENLT